VFHCQSVKRLANKANSAVNEMAPLGALQSFKIAPDGSLSEPLDTVSTLGADPAHVVALPNGKVVVMNYSTGDGRIIKTTHGGTKFDDSGPLIKFQVPPGTLSHPHQTVKYGNALLVPDLVSKHLYASRSSL
jgi:6-phosphogluconolactonase (cycloisomerase 2 family)